MYVLNARPPPPLIESGNRVSNTYIYFPNQFSQLIIISLSVQEYFPNRNKLAFEYERYW